MKQNSIFIADYGNNVLMSKEQIIRLLKLSFDAGATYTVGSHKDFKQIHPNKEEFVNSIIENK